MINLTLTDRQETADGVITGTITVRNGGRSYSDKVTCRVINNKAVISCTDSRLIQLAEKRNREVVKLLRGTK